MRSGSNHVEYQPLGVVGVISPWNYPVNLSLMPVVTAIAAGNRVMLKPSKFTPATNALLASMIGEIFPEDQVAVVYRRRRRVLHRSRSITSSSPAAPRSDGR